MVGKTDNGRSVGGRRVVGVTDGEGSWMAVGGWKLGGGEDR